MALLVRCKNAKYSNLIEGKEYTIEECDQNRLNGQLTDVLINDQMYDISRFEVIGLAQKAKRNKRK